jgi:hypothetical protein
MNSVFISHRHDDKLIAEQIRDALKPLADGTHFFYPNPILTKAGIGLTRSTTNLEKRIF